MEYLPSNEPKNMRLRLTLAFFMIIFVFNGWVLFLNFQKVSIQQQWVKHTYEVAEQLNLVNSEVGRAATDVRSYVITHDQGYLTTAKTDLDSAKTHFESFRTLTADNIVQQEYSKDLANFIDQRMTALERVESQFKKGSTSQEETLVIFRGEADQAQLMGQVISKMEAIEFNLLEWRTESALQSHIIFIITLILTTFFSLAVILFTFFQVRKNHLLAVLKAQEKTNEALESQKIAEIASLVAGDPSLENAGESVLGFFAREVGIVAAKLYLFDEHQTPMVVASYGTAPHYKAKDFEKKLILDAAKKRAPWQLNAVPENYWQINSGLGQSSPKVLGFLPLYFQGFPIGLIEMALFNELKPEDLALLQKLAQPIAIGLNAAQSRQALQALLEKTQQQTEELQAQQEELRVSNEELAEQTEALKQAQGNLESQRAELEQTNDQLEEQARTLEHQKDILNAKNDDLVLAQEKLELASRYKSEFLANMSHELRTPLNSSLILAKILADNAENNLTAEQVEFAQAISASGEDLLELINDILDLSKVEAGKLELHIEKIWIHKIKSSLQEMFNPLAKQKNLKFEVDVENNVLEWIETDGQRLEQILRNLLSNAFKFTSQGTVKVSIESQKEDSTFRFQIKDTGIGIAPENQDVIFDAFRQADGSTNRKFGGTGLGLSISRDLSHLLGGRITVESEEGKGSTFTLICPQLYQQLKISPETPLESQPKKIPSASVKSDENQELTWAPLIPDDRDGLDASERKILVIEDDENFAKILYGLSHELGFKCIVAGRAEEGCALANKLLPEAILLDMNLPDHSGLWALDRLKETPQTRHIPVHIFSVEDYSRTALQMGAIGYMLKPVKRNELEEAFKKIETKLSQKVKKLLVVEDDLNQRKAILKLVGGVDVEIVSVGGGAEALEQLKTFVFDCMIVDLNLPDMTGYELLESMTKQEISSYPPVIIYTGRSLTRDEEDELRKYSRSIILKGARSPERLLSEVGLFLHRVESKMPTEKRKMLQESRNREKIFENKIILIVDDDVRNIFALTSALQSKGAKIEIGRNGIQALEKLASVPKIDLVLMDIMMPEMDGYEAMRSIRKQKKFEFLPVIAVTARAMRDDQEKCLAAGANDYLSKPIDVDKLVSLIRVWLTTLDKRN